MMSKFKYYEGVKCLNSYNRGANWESNAIYLKNKTKAITIWFGLSQSLWLLLPVLLLSLTESKRVQNPRKKRENNISDGGGQ